MIVYMTHPQHGTHIAYSDDEVSRCKANGWSVRVDAPKPAPAPPPAPPAALPEGRRTPLKLPRRESLK